MNILSLFDGMCCGMLAFQKAKIAVDSYTAYEIDENAIQTATRNFPSIRECGDVFKADFKPYRENNIEYMVGGSPCTYWSVAQKNNRETEPVGLGWELFSQYARALKEVQPKFFIYENNKSMSDAVRWSITDTFGFEPICINSALVSAQNRQRLYWVGSRNSDGTYSQVAVTQPQDRGIYVKDILDTQDAEGDPVCCAERGRYGENGIEQHYEARTDGKTNTLTTVQKDNNIAEPVILSPIRVGALPRPNGELSTSQAMRVYSIEGKSVNLLAGGGGLGGKTGLYAVPVDFEGSTPVKAISRADGKTYPVYEVKNGMVVMKGREYPIKLKDGYYIIRKLTVSECKRLQTVPEWYQFPVSDAKAYKMLGNGWTVDVIVHLIEATL